MAAVQDHGQVQRPEDQAIAVGEVEPHCCQRRGTQKKEKEKTSNADLQNIIKRDSMGPANNNRVLDPAVCGSPFAITVASKLRHQGALKWKKDVMVKCSEDLCEARRGSCCKVSQCSSHH